jgi:superfamily I DNA/RNA helicase
VPSIRDDEEWDDPFGAVNTYLAGHKSPLQLFGSKSGSLEESDDAKLVYLMTYHNAKGLEFPYVFLPHLTDETSLEPMKNASINEEARIFFVAATRAKERLFLSYHGMPHAFVDALSELDEDTITTFVASKRRY